MIRDCGGVPHQGHRRTRGDVPPLPPFPSSQAAPHLLSLSGHDLGCPFRYACPFSHPGKPGSSAEGAGGLLVSRTGGISGLPWTGRGGKPCPGAAVRCSPVAAPSAAASSVLDSSLGLLAGAFGGCDVLGNKRKLEPGERAALECVLVLGRGSGPGTLPPQACQQEAPLPFGLPRPFFLHVAPRWACLMFRWTSLVHLAEVSSVVPVPASPVPRGRQQVEVVAAVLGEVLLRG